MRIAAVAPREHDAFVEHWQRVVDNPEGTLRIIDVDGEVAGWVTIFIRDGKRELGYWLGRTHWGRGIASDAVRQMLELDSERPLFAGVVDDNIASQRVLLKAGFVEVGATDFVDPTTGGPRSGKSFRLDRRQPG